VGKIVWLAMIKITSKGKTVFLTIQLYNYFRDRLYNS